MRLKEELFHTPQVPEEEREETLCRRRALLLAAPPQLQGFALLRELHRRLFAGIDPQAGELRAADLPLASVHTPICYTAFLQESQARIFAELESGQALQGLEPGELALELAYLDAQLTALHPFLAGNTAAIDCLLAILAQQAGCPLDAGACGEAALEQARERAIHGELTALWESYRQMLGSAPQLEN